MTLLGWMHRKLRSNNDVFKEFNTGGGGSCNCITGLASPDGEYFVDGAFAANHDLQPSLDAANDLFAFGGSGLLTIGTLGFAAVTTIPAEDSGEHDDAEDDEADHDDADVDVESNDEDGTDVDEAYTDADDGAVTPTFTFPAPGEKVEAIAEKDDGATTEDDLMLVSAELEKVLGATASGDVPSARVSFATTDCPLQGFLFGSPVCSDADSKPDGGGGGRRASLGELFLRTRFAEENKVALVTVAEGEDGGEGDKAEGKEGGGGGRKRMKKCKVKDEKGAVADGSRVNPTVTKSKFQKILQIFHRKVYPEGTAILARNLTKKNRKRGAPDNGDGGASTDEPVVPPKRTGPRMPSLGCCANRASFSASPDYSGELLNGSKSGHWIKTDADYLVLEL